MDALRWLLATLHLLALAIGFGAVWARARALRQRLDETGLRAVFIADGLWGLAALLWLVTGLWRAFGGVEKGTQYYLSNPVFHLKLTLFVVIFLLELPPMVGLIRWRIARQRGTPVDTARAPRYAKISSIQGVLLVLMVCAATAIARGFRF